VSNALWGAESISQRGDIHGNPGSRNHPQNKPLTGTVTLNESVETIYLTHTHLLERPTSNQEGGRGRGKNPQRFAKYRANDPQ